VKIKLRFMNKRILIPTLLTISVISMAYAIYRSTSQRITLVENAQTVVYGEPQHGLVLGLCIFSGICIIGAIILFLDRRDEVKPELPIGNKRTT
jgi:hypothetical protein